ncbi:MAG: hypothetical protein C4581_06270 [Nitrospiraceae bacterium]|nr:MAG: hypothetical protein C4581_06270 [Nitrospiraceae bacterium]
MPSEKPLNCWEVKKCGREPGGPRADELGVCPSSTEQRLHGVHSGHNAGRACWVIAGSMCGGKIQGTFAEKYQDCSICDFYMKVKSEEHRNFLMISTLLAKLQLF